MPNRQIQRAANMIQRLIHTTEMENTCHPPTCRCIIDDDNQALLVSIQFFRDPGQRFVAKNKLSSPPCGHGIDIRDRLHHDAFAIANGLLAFLEPKRLRCEQFRAPLEAGDRDKSSVEPNSEYGAAG